MKRLVFLFLLFFMQVTAGYAKSQLTPELLATQFNLRTIYSSIGPLLKTYCGSYPVDFFPADSVSYRDNKAIFETDIALFILKVVDENQIKVIDKIKSPGTYYTNKQYDVYFDDKNEEIRAKEAFIPVAKPCEPYPKEKAK